MKQLIVLLLALTAFGYSYSSSGYHSSSSSHSYSSPSSSHSYSSPSSYKSTSSSTYKPSSTYTPRLSAAPTSVKPYSKPTGSATTASAYKSSTSSKYTASSVKSAPTSTTVGAKTQNYSNSNSRSYSTYNRPLTRTPNWYSNNYHYHFHNSRYNSGYSYYPIMCDPFTGTLAGMVAGAMVTNMILGNGNRSPIYADGTGGAYTVQNGANIQVAQDENGNWVQLDPNQQQNQPQVVQQTAQPTQIVYVPQKKGLGFWGWIGVLGTIAVVALLGWVIFKN